MASVSELLKLFDAIGSGDTRGAREVALEIAEHTGKRGHRSAEKAMKGALVSRPRTEAVQVLGPAQIVVERSLQPISPTLSLEDIQMSPSLRATLLSLVEEYVGRWELKRAGIPNRNRVLFVGPPGCGKSASAKALGKALNLPVYVLRFDALIGSYLGQTAQNLRAIFEFIERTPSIVLMDEIDAISSLRGTSRDIGELDRVVIAFMQHLELTSPAGMLVCTSNLLKTIDPAVTRRFDAVVAFPKPRSPEIVAFAKKTAKKFNLNLTNKIMNSVRRCSSYADVERVIVDEVRSRILAAPERSLDD